MLPISVTELDWPVTSGHSLDLFCPVQTSKNMSSLIFFKSDFLSWRWTP